ncbi:MAG TPA: ergothioneine biosynthesis glutamate--cysteine ligase EgtA [Natronosporangium sp.]
MVTVERLPAVLPAEHRVLRTADEALEHVHAICFKTGPPRTIGVELEWTVHHADDPSRPIDPQTLRTALGAHTPRTLDPDSPHQPLPHGGTVTLEPGGQVEISTPPRESLAQLIDTAEADRQSLAERLASHGLRLGEQGIDAYRPPQLVLRTARYDAMADSFARHGPGGITMMCGTAATQVCLDAGEPDRVVARWRALHALGPVLLALFANSRYHAGRDTGWRSGRMRAWLVADPARTRPVPGGDPVTAWGRYALAAPLLCLRRERGSWHAPPGVTFADWITGKVRPPPTVDDLEYHLGTLFPPVRPRGYVEVRFLDAQPPAEWFAPVAVLAALLADPETTDQARSLAGAVEIDWVAAAQRGLADPGLRSAATAVAELAMAALDRTDLSEATRAAVAEIVSRRLAGGGESR